MIAIIAMIVNLFVAIATTCNDICSSILDAFVTIVSAFYILPFGTFLSFFNSISGEQIGSHRSESQLQCLSNLSSGLDYLERKTSKSYKKVQKSEPKKASSPSPKSSSTSRTYSTPLTPPTSSSDVFYTGEIPKRWRPAASRKSKLSKPKPIRRETFSEKYDRLEAEQEEEDLEATRAFLRKHSGKYFDMACDFYQYMNEN